MAEMNRPNVWYGGNYHRWPGHVNSAIVSTTGARAFTVPSSAGHVWISGSNGSGPVPMFVSYGTSAGSTNAALPTTTGTTDGSGSELVMSHGGPVMRRINGITEISVMVTTPAYVTLAYHLPG